VLPLPVPLRFLLLFPVPALLPPAVVLRMTGQVLPSPVRKIPKPLPSAPGLKLPEPSVPVPQFPESSAVFFLLLSVPPLPSGLHPLLPGLFPLLLKHPVFPGLSAVLSFRFSVPGPLYYLHSWTSVRRDDF
jgi:hypothetical protein